MPVLTLSVIAIESPLQSSLIRPTNIAISRRISSANYIIEEETQSEDSSVI